MPPERRWRLAAGLLAASMLVTGCTAGGGSGRPEMAEPQPAAPDCKRGRPGGV